ncbi:MAG: hypothetical protein IJL93_03920 [Bacteroidales bacterium]|nr:hypothetical protein [Bacteroidales bacterium]
MKKNILAIFALAVAAAFTSTACSTLESDNPQVDYPTAEFVQAIIIPRTQSIATESNAIHLHAAALMGNGQRIHLGAGDKNRHFRVKYHLVGNNGTDKWLTPDDNRISAPETGSVTFTATAEITCNNVKTLTSEAVEFTLTAARK